jgi:D-galactose 1-dehydrogenase
MTPVNVAIVGLGKIARDQHLPVIATNPRLQLSAIASQSAGLPDTPSFKTIEEALASDTPIDAVAICTPPQVRHGIAAAALKAGKHVLLEKPPCSTISELEDLRGRADAAGVTLYTAWHSRHAPAVDQAKALLADLTPTYVAIVWKEDVRRWHPGQTWIWKAGGMGVFDPAINALSIVTKILPCRLVVRSAEFDVPSNCEAPIAARVAFDIMGGGKASADLDFLQTGPQTWDISIRTKEGRVIVLRSGGAHLEVDGEVLQSEPEAEYAGVYREFVELIDAGRSDVDNRPFEHVADAFMLAKMNSVEPFIE